MVKEFAIWSEGYRATGDRGDATFMGISEGKTFREACNNFFKHRSDAYLFDKEDLTYWGCKLFDNEKGARVSYG